MLEVASISAYLWKADLNGKYFWKQAVFKKEEGGLGLKDIHMWNLACMAKHIWNSRRIDFWLWRKMLHLRNIIKPYVKMHVRNGRTANYLFDNWHEKGCLADIFSTRSINYLHIDSTQHVAEVSDMIRWPVGKANTFDVQVFKNGFPNHFNDNDDRLE
ncbi:hypothetical protein LIER_16708 [Lithospermum erythrorhizon]|uniref:Uncharacterized protein n=1 Tax=Lithospermum erythrorhizon TaxID=34254 RepID=A0AAV3QBU7_LITER